MVRTLWVSALTLVLVSSGVGTQPPAALALSGIGSGPAVGFDFDVAAFPAASGDAGLFVAWRDAQSNVSSGILRLEDEGFVPFPTLQSGYVTNLNVGVGGPSAARRSYVTWVGSQLELVLATFDVDGALLSSAQPVAASTQISPNRLAGTDAGVLVAHSWDTNPYWDPRILEVDVSGNVLGLEVADQIEVPEQTLGATVAAEPGGSHAIAYITSDTRQVRLRRYGPLGTLDPSPVTISGDAAPDYIPLSALILADVPSTLFLAFPYQPAGANPDVRFALAPLSGGSVTLGPTLSELVPGFTGNVSAMAALAGITPRAVVVWQEIEREDSATCGCSLPQPVRIDFFAQVLALSAPITAHGPTILVYRWQRGDAIGPPITAPRVLVTSSRGGEFTVVWSDGVLRYQTLAPTPVTVEEAGDAEASALTGYPNPFDRGTTIAYSVSRSGVVRLRIVDALGREVLRLSEGVRPPGDYFVTWDGRDRTGARVPAGIYFAHLALRDRVETRKLIFMK